MRGKIYDTKNRTLADSILLLLAIYSQLKLLDLVLQILEQVHEIWSRVGRAPEVSYEKIKSHMEMQPKEPLILYKNLSMQKSINGEKEFEKWTAPKRVHSDEKKFGLDLGRPLKGRSIVLETAALANRRTSTAANTLEMIYRISKEWTNLELSDTEKLKIIFLLQTLPLIAWTHLNKDDIAKWADRCSTLPGTDIICLPARTYPEKDQPLI